MTENQRLNFEDWADSQGLSLDEHFFDGGNNYEDTRTAFAYDVWEASRKGTNALYDAATKISNGFQLYESNLNVVVPMDLIERLQKALQDSVHDEHGGQGV